MTPRAWLAGLEFFGVKLGLDNINGLLDAAGRPHNRFPSAHIAGTNGKGSCAAFLAAMLGAAGYRVGRFTSPHILDVSERFLIGGTPIDHPTLDENLAFFQEVAREMNAPPTYFEVTTAAAFRWFAQRRVDFAVVEVGMGGRLDSTNVITPVVCAITSIDYDHMKYLGNTLEEIAFEKAGIIKPDVPTVTGERQTGPLRVIRAQAQLRDAPLRVLGEDFSYQMSGNPLAARFAYQSATLELSGVPLGLAGFHQGANAAVAVAAAETLRAEFPSLTPETIRMGLESARWPCRLERVLDNPPVYIDAAHNAGGARALAQALPGCVTVLALASDKAAGAVLSFLAPCARELILTRFQGPRAMPLETLRQAAAAFPYSTADTVEHAVELALERAAVDRPVLITGSLFTAAEARRVLMARHGAPPPRF